MRQVILSISALLLGIALIFLGHGMLGTLLPPRMGMAEFAPFVVGMVMSAYFVGQVFGGLALAVAVTNVAFFALPAGDEAPLLALVAVLGGAIFTLYPLCVAHTFDHIEPSDMVRASGGLLVIYGIGAAYTFWRMGQRPAPSAEEQGPFHPVPLTTPAANELDPRAESIKPSGPA